MAGEDTITLNRKEAMSRYGRGFMSHIMRDKETITVTKRQDAELEEYNLMKMAIIVPYKYQIVYVVEAEGWACKIGQTTDIKKRVRAFDSGIPKKILLRHVVLLDDVSMDDVERASHAVLKDHRVTGEWFEVDADDAIRVVSSQAERHGGSISLSDAWDLSESREWKFRTMHAGNPRTLRHMTDAKESLRWAIERMHSDMS